LGFLRRSNAQGEESPRPTFVGSPVLPGYPSAGPTPQTTVSLAGFSNLTATFFLSPPSHHFQMGGVRTVRPTGGCSFHEAPPARRRAAYPLDVVPAGCAAPVPRRGHPKARRKLPRSIRPPSLVVYRVFVLVEIDRTLEPLFTADLSDLPLLGFHLRMVFTRATGEGFPPLDR
jgi:hypothetical protein